MPGQGTPVEQLRRAAQAVDELTEIAWGIFPVHIATKFCRHLDGNAQIVVGGAVMCRVLGLPDPNAHSMDEVREIDNALLGVKRDSEIKNALVACFWQTMYSEHLKGNAMAMIPFMKRQIQELVTLGLLGQSALGFLSQTQQETNQVIESSKSLLIDYVIKHRDLQI